MTKPQLDPGGIPVLWWIATSTKAQKLSPLAQWRLLRQVSEQNGLRPVCVLRVPGYSRQYIFWHEAASDLAAYRQLPGVLERLRPKFLLVQARDRLGREALAGQVEALCERYGCKVWSIRLGEPLGGNVGQIFAAGMETTMSRAESEQTNERRMAAMRRRVEDHKLPYNQPEYGYVTVRDDRGRPVGVAVDPEEGPIRQLMDEWFAGGLSARDIAIRLNRRGVRSPRGKDWAQPTVFNLLRSRFASGWLKVAFEEKTVEVEGDHPRLRTAEMQAAIDGRWQHRKRGSQRGTSGGSRFYGVAFCADCGGRMHRNNVYQGTRYYACGTYMRAMNRGRKECTMHSTPEPNIVAAVADYFAEPFNPARLNATPNREGELGAARKRLAEVKAQKMTAVRDRVRYRTAAREFDLVLEELTAAEEAAEAEVSALIRHQALRPDCDLAQAFHEQLRDLPLAEWLTEAPPESVRDRLAGRVRVSCPQREPGTEKSRPLVTLLF